MVAIVDYGAGNIKSVENAVRYLGHEAVLTRDPAVILSADHVILPGVGAFGDAMTRLSRYGLDEVLRKAAASGIPFLGICLGLQLLFESSEESPGAEGLGILKGHILRIPDGEGRKVPQIGWNDLTYPNPGRDVLNIRTALENAHLEVFDLNGRLMHSQRITDNVTTIDAAAWPSGVYVWKVYTNQAGPSTGSGTLVETGQWIKE